MALNELSIAAFMRLNETEFRGVLEQLLPPIRVRLESMNLNEYETKNNPWLIISYMGRM